MTTIAKFVLWLLTFGAAYFIQSTELISLATAFFALHAAIIGILLVSLLLVCAFGKEPALKTYGSFLIRILRFSVAILITSIFSFVATRLVTVDFCTAYMLTTLGQCMYNIDVVDESDFAKLKAKLKAKKNGKKVKALNAAHVDKKKPTQQTIADKKVQQQYASHEMTPVPGAFPMQDDEEIPEVEATPVIESVPAEEVVQENTPELTLDIDVEPPQNIEPNELEPQLKPVPDIPVD